MKPSVVAIIPVRGSDPEVQSGDMMTLGGKPLLAYAIDAAAGSQFITRTLVSTDDANVMQLAVRLGAEAPFLRPAELSAPQVSLAEVLRHALLWLEEHEGYHVDLVVLLEITHPLRPPGLVDHVIQVLLTEKLDSVFAAREEHHEFWTVTDRGVLERFHPRDGTPRKDLAPLYREMGGMATAIRADLIRQGRRFGERVGLVPVHDVSSLIDLHDEHGLRLAQAILKQRDVERSPS